MSHRGRWLGAWAVALALAAAACGQKPGVHSPAPPQQVVEIEEEAPAAPQAGETTEPATEQQPSRAAPAPSPAAGLPGRPAAPAGVPGGVAAAGAGPADRTGITEGRILVGLHAPLTGAAAVPLVDIQFGVDLYRKWLAGKGVRVHGREVQIIFKDDQYNPSHAVSVCREMVEKDKVFALIGAAGTDQIQACARYAASVGVPYLSLGVTEKVVSGLRNYFAFSMTYPDQARPLAQLVRNFGGSFTPRPPAGQTYGGGPVLVDRCNEGALGGTACAPSPGAPGPNAPKIGVVYSDTEAFHDARDAFVREMGGGARTYPITKFNISSTDAGSLIQQLKREGVDVAYVLTSPTNWLSILGQANSQQYHPRWIGVGLTMGINTVPQVACTQNRQTFENSLFLSPWFSVHRSEGEPSSAQFAEAWNSYGNGDRNPQLHDLGFALFGFASSLHVMFEAAGADVSRQSFVTALEGLRDASPSNTIKALRVGDIFSRLTFTPTDHFGADQAHLLWASCPLAGTGYWNFFENGQFRTGF